MNKDDFPERKAKGPSNHEQDFVIKPYPRSGVYLLRIAANHQELIRLGDYARIESTTVNRISHIIASLPDIQKRVNDKQGDGQ